MDARDYSEALSAGAAEEFRTAIAQALRANCRGMDARRLGLIPMFRDCITAEPRVDGWKENDIVSTRYQW